MQLIHSLRKREGAKIFQIPEIKSYIITQPRIKLARNRHTEQTWAREGEGGEERGHRK